MFGSCLFTSAHRGLAMKLLHFENSIGMAAELQRNIPWILKTLCTDQARDIFILLYSIVSTLIVYSNVR